jgi:WD40 repeat protein
MKHIFVVIMLCFTFVLAAPSSPNLRLLEVAKEFSFQGYESQNSQTQLSPTGKIAATWDGNQRIILWNTATGKFIRDYAPKSNLEQVIFSDDSTLQVLVSDTKTQGNGAFISKKYTRVTVPRTGVISSQALADQKKPFRLVLLNNNLDMVVEHYNSTQIEFTSGTGEEVTIELPSKEIRCSSVSANKKFLLCGGAIKDGEVSISYQYQTFNLETGQLVQQFSDVFGDPWSTAISPDGLSVALAFGYVARVSVWKNGKKIKVLRQTESQSNIKIAFANEKELLWNFQTRQSNSLLMQRWSLESSQLLGQKAFEDVGTVEGWSNNLQGAVYLERYNKPTYIDSLGKKQTPELFNLSHSSLSPDGEKIAFTSWFGQVRILNLKTGEELNRFSIEGGDSLSWAENNRWLILNHQQIWDSVTGKLLYQRKYGGLYFPTSQGVLVIATAQSSQLLLFPFEELKYAAKDENAFGKEETRARAIGQPESSCRWIVYPDGERALCYTPKVVKLYRLSDGQELWSKQFVAGKYDDVNVEISPDGRFIARFDEQKTFYLLDSKTGNAKKTFRLNKFELDNLKSLSPNNRFALFSNTLFDLEILTVLPLPEGIQGELKFDATGRYLIESKFGQNAVRLWALPNRQNIF